MKNTILVIITCLIVLGGSYFFFNKGFSLSLGNKKTITVIGIGKVKIKPEVARFTAGVQEYSSTIDGAVNQEKKVTRAIIEALKEAGVKDEDIKTAYYSIWPQTSETWEGTIKRIQITGYGASNNVEVKVKNVEAVSSLLGKVIAAGANSVFGLNFGADEPKRQEEEAREKAIEEAKEKAEKMVTVLGRKLGKVISVTEGYSLPPVSYYSGDKGGAGGGGSAIETGGLEVIQTVTVVFELK